MNKHIDSSRFSIGKSGTGIGKSGTGIGKSGTGIGKSGTGSRMAGRLLAAFALLALTLPLSLVAGSPQSFLMDVHEGTVTVTLHDEGRVVSGQATLSQARGGLVRVPMRVIDLDGSASRTASHGSGSGGQSVGGCSGLMSHGSGSGGQSVGGCGSLMSHGSGSGGQSVGGCGSLMSHGSGSGGQSVGGCGSLMSHGSGSGGQSVGSCGSLMSHGSGSGGQSVGGCSGLMSHGSGSGGQSIGKCKSAEALWGYAEVLAGADDFNVIVFRLDQSGPIEHLIVAADRSASDQISNMWVAEP